MSTAVTKLAILGAGIFVEIGYLPAIITDKSVSLVALWSRSEKTVKGLAGADILKNQNQPDKLSTYFGDDGFKEILARKDIEGVIIALPIDSQPAIIEACLAAGKHVLSEKPIAKDVADGKKIIELYESTYAPKNLIWRVAEDFTHEPAVVKASEIIKSGVLGRVLFYEMRMTNYVPLDSMWVKTPWRTVPNYQGGFLLDGGVHQVSALRTVLGDSRPTQVNSHASLNRTHLPPHDTFVALTSAPKISNPPIGDKFPEPENPPQGMGKSSPSGIVLMSAANPDLSERIPWYLKVTTDKAVLNLGSAGWHEWTLDILSKDEKASSVLGGKTLKWEKGTAIYEKVNQFAAAIRGDKETTNKALPRDTLWDVAFIQAALESDGKPVDLEKLALF